MKRCGLRTLLLIVDQDLYLMGLVTNLSRTSLVVPALLHGAARLIANGIPIVKLQISS